MKHRSTAAFILLASALFAAPQVSQDISAVKSALGSRVRVEILNAFLSLNAGSAPAATAPSRAGAQLASCKGAPKQGADSPAWSNKGERRANPPARAGRAARHEANEELAMLVEHLPLADMIRAGLPGIKGEDLLGRALELPHGALARGEFAMLIPPGSGVEPSAVAGGRAKDSAAAARRRAAAEEAQKHVAYFAARHEQAQGAKAAGAEAPRGFDASVTEANGIRTAEKELRLKVMRLRRQPGQGGGASPAPAATRTAPVAALVPPDLAPPAACAETVGE